MFLAFGHFSCMYNFIVAFSKIFFKYKMLSVDSTSYIILYIKYEILIYFLYLI